MARPQKNTVAYFPFYCEDGKKMYYLEETYGNDGFATFLKILRELARTEYHYLNLSENTTIMFLSAKCKVSKETLLSIIKDLVDLGKFDTSLWNENKIIWCQDFIDSIQDAYEKRKNKCITYDGLILLLVSLGVRKPLKSKIKGVINTQIKEDKSKEEENKEKSERDLFVEFRIEELDKIPNQIFEKLRDIYKISEPIVYAHKTKIPVQYFDLVEFLADSIECEDWLLNLTTRFGDKRFGKAMVDYVNLLKTNYEYMNFETSFDFRKYFANWFNTKQDKY